MESSDYYAILGVTKGASESEIKKAYRDLARKYHPDVYKGTDAQTRFKEINEAYQVLSDPKKKAAYDQYGHDAFRQAPSGQSWGGWGSSGGFDSNFRDPFDIFEDFFGSRSPFGFDFGGGGRNTAVSKGSDLQFELTVPFEEAVFGTSRSVALERVTNCHLCGGSGGAKGSKEKTCGSCGGRGVVGRSARTIFGNVMTSSVCGSCGGRGKSFDNVCHVCKGKGIERTSKNQTIKIPAGVDNGTIIRFQGLGDAGANGGGYGDLYLTVHVLASTDFKRSGQDIIYELMVSITQATLGVEIFVPTLEGKEKLKIPAGTQPGESMLLKHKGIPSLSGSGRGDEIVMIKVLIPTRLTRKQQELLRDFEHS